MLSVETAAEFLDMGRRVGEETGRSQLEAAVAIYNLLERQRVAYLADEVGMGKTYVALGALALLRHFKPRTRLLVLAPRENIQKKWMKELRTFTDVCVRYPDLRVKALQGTPSRGLVSCANLVELAREVTIDPDRDFFARITSFSFGLRGDGTAWKETRDKFLEYLPAEDPASFDLRDRVSFKDAIGGALARALPRFDLVIVDEAHNLKAGFRLDHKSQASRNRMLGLAFGAHAEGSQRAPRVQRLLLLSATPVDDDYRQLWNQLDLFGRAGGVPELKNDKLNDEVRRSAAKRILIRRVTSLDCSVGRLTKTQYRREWRRGGVDEHDFGARIDDSQKLTAALVQKKVGELLNSPRFNANFQIGMLASFESFLETRGLRREGLEEGLGRFDDAAQTDDPTERAGIDVDIVNALAKDYRRRFGDRELPHPKMDALVGHLADAFKTGQKALVFVRRVASVRELRRKLERLYDDYIITRLRNELIPELRTELEAQISEYQRVREERPDRDDPVPIDIGEDVKSEGEATDESEGGTETFFAWFFRGEGPDGVFSGANFQKRFLQKRAAVATVFEDNHVAWLLDVQPGEVLAALEARSSTPREALVANIRSRAAHYNPDAKPTRKGQFLAWQAAALEWLQGCADATIADRATHVWIERYQTHRSSHAQSLPPNEPSWLEEPTLFTELRRRPSLCRALWPDSTGDTFAQQFRDHELRRELLSTMARLGHAFVDLYILAANQLGSLKGGARPTEDSGRDLIAKFLDVLEAQALRPSEWRAFYELADAAANFDAIVDANLPELRQQPLIGVGRELGELLKTQQPIGGMSGGVNQRLVRQFRMAGYPCVLVTTDVLQEGEDLHLFCSRVYHYGLSWTPSSMEQRVGRIDRVRSQTHRELEALERHPDGHEKLQVFYPHLRETAEAYQVQTVLERLNRFLVLMHTDLRTPDLDQRQLNIREEVARGLRDVPAITAPLTSAFPVPNEYLGTDRRALGIGKEEVVEIGRRFAAAADALDALNITWIRKEPGVRVGVLRSGDRQQPLSLFLRSVDGHPSVRCVSPIGTRDDGLTPSDIQDAFAGTGVRIAVVYNQSRLTYEYAVEGDVLLWPGSDAVGRIEWLVKAVTGAADRTEERLLEIDPAPTDVEGDLSEEPGYAR